MAALRYLARRTLALLAGILLVATLALGLAQTGPGKHWLALAIGGALSDGDQRVVVTGLSGFVPFDATIARIAIGMMCLRSLLEMLLMS